MNRRLCIGAVLLGAAACTADLPDVDPEQFACIDDSPLEDGIFQCPADFACRRELCVRRFGCFIEGEPLPGCEEFVNRCDLDLTDQTAAVRCEPGLHTTTSTLPEDPVECLCPDGTHCTVLAAVPDGEGNAAYPLYVLPPGVDLPVGQLGIETDGPRTCTRACAAELDCPANHTCRAAAVVGPGLLEEPSSGRSTIGVCMPELLLTSTTSADGQVDRLACNSGFDCELERGRIDGACQVRVEQIPDHPNQPAGEAWTSGRREARALRGRCIGEPSISLIMDGMGCTESETCRSGVCFNRRCATVCDPAQEACSCRSFVVERVLRATMGGAETKIFDRLNLCAR